MNQNNTFNWELSAYQAAGQQSYPKACLYLVPTPIGNLADITFRSLHVLSIADVIASEDTRHTQQLLSQYGLKKKKLFSLHQHNEKEATAHLLELLAQDLRIALVTDAGTPAISDPGAYAVQAVQKAGFRIMPLPGASSVTTAMSAAGITHGNTLFAGFLPTKKQERLQTLQDLLTSPNAIVLLEAPHRIRDLFEELHAHAPDRSITIARELTKQFEQVITLPTKSLITWLEKDSAHQKGEFVCVIHAPNAPAKQQNCAYDEALLQALNYMPTKVAASFISNLTGLPKNTLYQRAIELKKKPL